MSAAYDANGRLKVCVGASIHEAWIAYGSSGSMYQDISISSCGFTDTPEIFTSLSGLSSHWTVTGVTSIYSETKSSFRIYINSDSGTTFAQSYDWSLNWVAFGL